MGSRGVDVSSYQEPADWKASDPDFVIIKASEGEHSADSRFRAHVAQARGTETLAGAYHFGWPVNDPHGDAENFVSRLGDTIERGDIRFVALDVETYPDRRNVEDMSADAIRRWGEKWAAYVRRELHTVKVGAYGDLHHYWLGWIPKGMDFYWVAEYPGGMTYPKAEHAGWPNTGSAYPEPLFWQFSGSPLDLDLCALDTLSLRRLMGTPVPAPPKRSPRPVPSAPTYRVVAGDTLSQIAVRHHVSLADLEHANPQVHNPDVIHVGQLLHLPHGARALPKASTYKVRKGDTMTKIAAMHGVTLAALERANRQVRNPNLIMIGQVLHLPAKG